MTRFQRTAGLHVESFGTGPELVMLHGWAMHSGLWRDFAERLAGRYRITLVDLPGHGRSGPLADYALEAVIGALVEVVPPAAHWLGWSLGALLAIGVARAHPGRVRTLTLITGSPRFTAEGEWPGVRPELLARMATDFEQDYATTLKRFISLQTYGQDQARALARLIQSRLDECPPPEASALRGGLALLQSTDLRDTLAMGGQPVLALLGGHDRLVPKDLALPLRALSARVAVEVLPAAAHLPFLTHAEATAGLIQDFLDRHVASGDR